MQLIDLRRALRSFLSEAGTGVYSDTLLNDRLNTSARALAAENGLIQSVATLTSAADGTLTLAPNTANVFRATLPLSGAVLPLISMADALSWNPRAFTASGAGGAPSALIVDEAALGPDTARLYPLQTTGTDVLVQAYSRGADMLTDTDVPWGNRYADYHQTIAYHAAHHLLPRQGATAAANATWMQRYESAMQELRDAGSTNSLSSRARIAATIRPRRYYR